MKLSLLVVTLSCLMGVALGSPVDGDLKTDNRVGLDRPSTETPPQLSECGLDSLLAAVYGTSGSSNCNNNTPPEVQSLNPGGGTSEPIDPQPIPQPGPGNGDCSCVQYYLCTDNNTLIEDGTNIIDIR